MNHQVIEGRSPQQVRDDDLLLALKMLEDGLKAWGPGVGLLYTHTQRDRMKALKAQVEEQILDGNVIDYNIPWSWRAADVMRSSYYHR
jgi:hypothetical protein